MSLFRVLRLVLLIGLLILASVYIIGRCLRGVCMCGEKSYIPFHSLSSPLRRIE
ncbi:hypothetical protein HETIRDRAFT_169799 [Heterobasidion irregulare TC 32-1]|uniref:Uncharacterized protein n=1 Tax=Heterobasidion irregulare (strain TC 32-1) TaxID=747525 RepID=W4K5L5_HETIT|nr:uncharacterized protein HETIRDRAFT_169799 [Heterobasidion irregulare TC 32-1]ETW81054.1 hypothetical protein HETIRDRAFT_169799 [Heterobasidion irregulare TC 32-1]